MVVEQGHTEDPRERLGEQEKREPNFPGFTYLGSKRCMLV
jgi:hypothetical protein